MSFTIHLTWKGSSETVTVPVLDPTLDALGKAIEVECGAAFETIKLLVPGRKGHIAPAKQQDQLASQAGNQGSNTLFRMVPEPRVCLYACNPV
jgi:hypothetical protein